MPNYNFDYDHIIVGQLQIVNTHTHSRYWSRSQTVNRHCWLTKSNVKLIAITKRTLATVVCALSLIVFELRLANYDGHCIDFGICYARWLHFLKATSHCLSVLSRKWLHSALGSSVEGRVNTLGNRKRRNWLLDNTHKHAHTHTHMHTDFGQEIFNCTGQTNLKGIKQMLDARAS